DVFTVLVQQLPTFTYDQHRSFRAWLRTLTLNKWRDLQRRRAARPPAAGAAALADVAVPDDTGALGEREYRQLLLRPARAGMRAEFQPTTWQGCWKYVAEDRPAAQVAAELGLSVGAVYVAKSRVLRRLRQELEGLLD